VYVSGRGALHGVANGATGGITIRGLSGSPNSQILVVEDGVADYQGIFGHPIPDAYTPFLLEEAIVQKGGDSVLFGSNAMGGVILLQSRWREKEGHEIAIDSAYGSYTTSRQAVAILGRQGAVDGAGAFLALSSDGHRSGAGGNEIVAQGAARLRLGGKIQIQVREKLVHLQGADAGPATHPHPDHTFDVWRNNTSARLDWRGDRARFSMTSSLNCGIHRLYDGFYSVDTVASSVSELEFWPTKRVDLRLGLAANRMNGKVKNRITNEKLPVSALEDLAAYQQVLVRPLKTLVLVGGMRELLSNAYGSALLYKAGLRLTLFQGLHLHGHLTRNYRQPTIRELYLPFPIANPNLRPEYSQNGDLGLSWFSPHIEAALTGYRTSARDMIRYFGSWPTAEVVNVDRVTMVGLEGLLGLRHLGPFSLTVTGDIRDVGRYTRQNPQAKFNFTLLANKDWDAHSLSASLTGEWVHGLAMANYGRQPMADVFAMDLSLRARFNASTQSPSIEPYLLVRNVLDQRYAYVANYPMPGLNILLGITMEL
jgi:iron complex outermembrane receptor protein